jgi:hypothetical protein
VTLLFFVFHFLLEQILVTMITGLTISIVVLAIQSSGIIAQDACKYTDPQKGTIDLTSLGRTDGRPAYPDRIPSSGSNYSTFKLF